MLAMSNDNLSDEDKELFRQMMKAVKPLDKCTPLSSNKSSKTTHVEHKKETIKRTSPQFDLSNYYQEVVGSDTILSHCKQSIPRKRLIQLRNGQIPYEARLDLHGLRPDAARESLCHFIDQQMQRGHRCLLIIHGKGGRSGEAPILKNHVNHWLQQLPQVLAFHSTTPRDGGSGALYVLLERQR